MGAQIRLRLKKNVYILFVDPENCAPQISFLSLKNFSSQGAPNIKLALLQVFQYTDMPELKDKIVFLASHAVSVNSRFKARLATKF